MQKLAFFSQGESGLVVELADKIDLAVNTMVHALSRLILAELGGLVDAVVPTYRSLLVIFDPLQINRETLQEKIAQIYQQAAVGGATPAGGKIVVIPVLYGGEFGPDLEFVARHNNLTTEEVIAIHTAVSYRIFMMGFTPGFPYLGGMSERIAAPRLSTPRKEIPAGSVGIAGMQTGLYPQKSPGGWQLIGRTPLKVFDPESAEPFLYQAGDLLRFNAISEVEYARIERAVSRGEYLPQIRNQAEVVQ